jgi:hypothetical protein
LSAFVDLFLKQETEREYKKPVPGWNSGKSEKEEILKGLNDVFKGSKGPTLRRNQPLISTLDCV